MLPFRWVRLAGGNYSNDVLVLKIQVTDNKDVEPNAQTKEYEPLVAFRVLRVRNHPRKVIEEGCLGFVKRNSMPLQIRHVFSGVSRKPQVVHT